MATGADNKQGIQRYQRVLMARDGTLSGGQDGQGGQLCRCYCIGQLVDERDGGGIRYTSCMQENAECRMQEHAAASEMKPLDQRKKKRKDKKGGDGEGL